MDINSLIERIYTQNKLAVSRAISIVESGNNDSTLLLKEIHKETGKTMIKIVDRESDEVIREIPSEEALERSKQLQICAGQLFDEIV